ncbi:hypothetical protein IEZ26_13380 [Nocardioides cavernae]|uniref:DUF4352 domain-containing protein n=1 Tax=Nocardioides cavernae TaxID=1921566 RepID=A0ABR8NBV6_9ACTN|nr:hypothetical protein [Nocardioides cavernae]MBD3925622.1 hypothetical protein [Nocardioides cavernae]MBM7513998.1 hypothetical protein [Nocardioides cavernae]
MRRTTLLATALALTLAGCSDPGPTTDEEPTAAATTAVDDGTEPGTRLEHGETATLVWQPTRDVDGELELSVDEVAEQRPSVFDGWTRDGAIAAARPYFVTVNVANTGESDLGGQDVPLYLRDTAGTLGAPWTLGGDFTACQSGPLPVPFEPGDETGMCLVYLVPDGGRVRDLVFQPTEGYDPISWTGKVQEPSTAEPGRERGRG